MRVATKGLRWLDPKVDKERAEIGAAPFGDVQVTHLAQKSRLTGVTTDRYYAEVKFDQYVTNLTVQLTSAQFGLFMRARGKAFIPNQCTAQCRVRPLIVRYPANGGKEARDTHTIELMLCDGVVIEIPLDVKAQADFLKLFQDDLKDPDFKKKWDWFVRDAAPNEAPAADPEDGQSTDQQ